MRLSLTHSIDDKLSEKKKSHQRLKKRIIWEEKRPPKESESANKILTIQLSRASLTWSWVGATFAQTWLIRVKHQVKFEQLESNLPLNLCC